MPKLFPTAGVDEAPYNPMDSPRQGPIYGRTVQFDYDKHEYILSPTGRMPTTQASDAWGEWCVKALSTERYKYLIYTPDYGVELDTLIGQSRPHAVIESEIRRMVRECLMCDPRTAGVDNFRFRWIDDGIMFSCRVRNTLGEAITITRTVMR